MLLHTILFLPHTLALNRGIRIYCSIHYKKNQLIIQIHATFLVFLQAIKQKRTAFFEKRYAYFPFAYYAWGLRLRIKEIATTATIAAPQTATTITSGLTPPLG